MSLATRNNAADADGEARPSGGKATAGSRLQIQVYVNWRRSELEREIRGALPELDGMTFDWRSPIAGDGYREYWDKAFLDAVDQGHHWPSLHASWPKGGPHWDALARVGTGGERAGVLLVEAKSYVAELLKGSAIGQTVADSSRRQIELAMAWTQGSLGVCDRLAEDWLDTPLYQSANRLAHLRRLNCLGVDACLVDVLFTGDDYTKPATDAQWDDAVQEVKRRLGLEERAIPRFAHVTLPAVLPSELPRGEEQP